MTVKNIPQSRHSRVGGNPCVFCGKAATYTKKLDSPVKPGNDRFVLFDALNSEGMALVLTLMVVAVLTAMVVELSYAVYVNTQALYNWRESQRLSLASKSGIKLASDIISEHMEKYAYSHPGLLKDYNEKIFAVSDAGVSIKIEEESAKFNLNSLIYPNGALNSNAYDSFVRLLKSLSLEPDIANKAADWIDPDSEPRMPGSEYKMKNDYMDSVDELMLIDGMDGASYDSLLPYVTIYGKGLININSADVSALMSLSDSIDKETAERVKRFRENTPFEKAEDILKVAGFETIGTSLMGRITVKGSAFHITSTSKAGNMAKIVEAVIETKDGGAVVKYWKEM